LKLVSIPNLKFDFINFVKEKYTYSKMLYRLKLVFFLLLLCKLSNSTAQGVREVNFLGKPRFVLEESFGGAVDNNVIIKTGKDRQISWMNDNKMEFDRHGNLIKRSYYNDYREFIHAEEYEFNNLKLNNKKYLSFIYSYVYDDGGNIIEELVAPVSDSTAKTIKHRYAYDTQNRLSDAWEFDFNGGRICHQHNTYNVLGLLSKEFYSYSDGNEYKTFRYDTDQNLVKMEWFDEKIGLLERTTYSYRNGKLWSEIWEGLEKNKVETTIKYEYDNNGNILSMLEINPKRQIHDHEINKYTFDQYGNWIKKTTAVNDIRFYIVERIIAYY
jgi:hypothetical protein